MSTQPLLNIFGIITVMHVNNDQQKSFYFFIWKNKFVYVLQL
uniref:Uncharacterized protein n=1 Tax=Heterorhabditis bacteriophora TaxID=37862 RepID=A0A1I7WBF2_HETBA